jgi:hypothetical protein
VAVLTPSTVGGPSSGSPLSRDGSPAAPPPESDTLRRHPAMLRVRRGSRNLQVKIGVGLPQRKGLNLREDIIQLAIGAEQAGFSSLWGL